MHTSGPWAATVADTINDKPAYWIIEGAGGVIGDVQSVNPADARLLAAAPDLLALARQYANDMRYPPADDSRKRRLAAIEAVLNQLED